MFKRLAAGVAACLALVQGASVMADATAWLPEPESGYLSLTFVNQVADEFYLADELRPTPQSADLLQGTAWFSAGYAVADGWALDAQIGWAKSDFETGPGIPTDQPSFSGLVDTSIGITRRVLDEATGAVPSVALRLGVIAAGDYDTGRINSLGDGGNGYEASVVAGRFIGARLGLSGEVGYRNRDSGIPAEHFANLTALWLLSDVVSLGLDYRLVDASADLDIGGPGFLPERFPEVEEDHQSIGIRAYFSLGQIGVSGFHSRVIDGRNTAASHVFGLTLSRSLGVF